jgi:hypothetical protein
MSTRANVRPAAQLCSVTCSACHSLASCAWHDLSVYNAHAVPYGQRTRIGRRQIKWIEGRRRRLRDRSRQLIADGPSRSRTRPNYYRRKVATSLQRFRQYGLRCYFLGAENDNCSIRVVRLARPKKLFPGSGTAGLSIRTAANCCQITQFCCDVWLTSLAWGRPSGHGAARGDCA